MNTVKSLMVKSALIDCTEKKPTNPLVVEPETGYNY